MIDVRTIGRRLPRKSFSEGSIEKVGTRVKKWRGYWFVYEMVDGRKVRRKREKILGLCEDMDKTEARVELREYIAESRGELPPAPENPTVDEFWKRYCDHKEQQWSNHTKRVLVSTFKTSVLPSIGNVPIKELTLGPLQAILNGLAKKGRSESAVKKVRTHVKAMLEYAVDERILPSNPARGKKLVLPTKGVKKPSGKFYELDQVRAIIAGSTGRERIAFRLLLTCGLRSQELVLLRVNDLGPGVVTVDEAFKIAETGSDRIGEPKTEESGKPAPIPRDLERELRQYIREQGLADADLIWGTAAGTPIHPHNYLTRTLQPIAAAAGVKGFTYQAARRTCATHFGDTKVAQRQLRHSNPNTTRKHYEQVIPEEHRKRIEEVDAAMRKPKAKVTPIRKRA